uniref:Uncharacterized protein n=1 Tax=Avena sativa TaxID=4498 RepID=A0ACD5Z0U2_AVESA
MPPEPHYRGWFEEPLAYDGIEDMFSVQVDHGGFFCSVRGDLTYEGGTTEYFDNCSSETFSLFWIEEFLRHLGYEMDDMLSVYWKKPGKDLLDGLQCIESDSDIVDMIAGRMEEKTLAMLIDHKNFLETFMPDVVEKKSKEGGSKGDGQEVATTAQGNNIPLVASDLGVECNSVAGGSKVDEEEGGFSDSESDSTFNDSDYDVEDGDDDLFTDNIDKEIVDYNEPVNEFELEYDSALQDTSLILRQEHEQDL